MTVLAQDHVWSGPLHHVPPRNPTFPLLPGLWVNFNFSLPSYLHNTPKPGFNPPVGAMLAGQPC